MKTLYTFILLLFIAALAHAQIPNGSFENWTNGVPTGWNAVNSPDTLVVQSTDAWDGTYAVRFNVSELGGITFGGYLFAGDSGGTGYVSIPYTPGALYGWYIANTADSGDELTINSSVTINGLVAGQIGTGIVEKTLVYKQFNFNYDTAYVTPGADSLFLEFGVQNQIGDTLSTATYFIIDDLTFGPVGFGTGITAVNEEATLERIVPNPAATGTDIIYSINNRSTVNMALYDVVGNKVKTLLDNTEQSPGRYKIPTDVSELPNGVYFCAMNVNGQIYTQKLLVTK